MSDGEADVKKTGGCKKNRMRGGVFFTKSLASTFAIILVVLYAQNSLQTNRTEHLFEKQREITSSRAEQMINAIRLDRIRQMAEIVEVASFSEKLTSSLSDKRQIKDEDTLSLFASQFLVSVNALEVFFYNKSVTPVYSSTYLPPADEVTSLAAETARSKKESALIACLPQNDYWKDYCVQYVGIPILNKGQDAGIVIIGFSLNTVFKMFEEVSGARIYLANQKKIPDYGEQFRVVQIKNTGIPLPPDRFYVAVFSAKEEIDAINRLKVENRAIVLLGILLVSLSSFIFFRANLKYETEMFARDEIERTKVAEQFGREKSELLDRVSRAAENERRYIAMELHDEIGQRLVSIRFNANLLEKKCNSPECMERLNQIKANINVLHSSIRSMTDRLRPPLLDTMGLRGSLDTIISELKDTGLAGDIKFSVVTGGLPDDVIEKLEDPTKVAIYRIVQEGLTNIAKHAKSTKASIKIAFDPTGKFINLTITDNGHGFNQSQVVSGMGLNNIKERISSLGGTFAIESAPSAGTKILATLPI